MNLILFENAEANENFCGKLPLRDERALHLLKVLHKKEGDCFDAGILGGKLGTGIITKIATDMEFCFKPERDPPRRMPLRLAVGFSRPIQIKRILRDCSSLGLEALDLVGSDLGEKSYQNTKLLEDGGARAALIDGAVQARDTRLPVLSVKPDFDAWLKARLWPPETLLVAADNIRPLGSFSLPGKTWHAISPAVLAVGSERGWSERERNLLEAAGFIRLSIGKRALRTETACTAAAVLLLDKMGQLE